jgi:toxin-antitoxin system PIN domain toxin
MFLLDVNVVLAAHRDDHPHHPPVRAWLDRALAGDRPVAVPVTVWGTFLRLATNRRVFEVPTPRPDAFAFIDAVRAQPLHVELAPGPRHLALVRMLCDEADATGDLVPDAVIGALAVEYGYELVTLDRDLARFPSVRHLRPPEVQAKPSGDVGYSRSEVYPQHASRCTLQV